MFWEYEVEAVPRLGEHVNLQGYVYVVVEVQHVPQKNTVMISVRNADGG